jgi:hypothetical protein
MNLLLPASPPRGAKVGQRRGAKRRTKVAQLGQDDRVVNVNVGGNVVEIRKGEVYF